MTRILRAGSGAHGHDEGVVEDDGAGESDRGEDVHGGGRRPVPFPDEPEPRGGRHSEPGEEGEVLLARCSAVRDRTQDRRRDQDEGAPDGIREPELGGAGDRVRARAPVLLEEDREESGDDGGREHRVRPVVQRPGEDRPAGEQLAYSFHGSGPGWRNLCSVKAAWIPAPRHREDGLRGDDGSWRGQVHVEGRRRWGCPVHWQA